MLDQYYIIIMPAVTPPVMLRLQGSLLENSWAAQCELKEWTEFMKSEFSSK